METKYALKQTIPVMVGYLFLGMAFGLMLHQAGYHFLWALLISACVYAGSMQFVLVSMLVSGIDPATAAAMTLGINSRHFFYGLSSIERFRNMGRRFPYLVFALTDETFALLSTLQIPEQLDSRKVVFRIALFNQIYWITGSVLGAIGGDLIKMDFSGIEFAMTALFVVLLIEQLARAPQSMFFPALAGLASAIVTRIIFGPDQFILPALVLALSILLFMHPAIAGRDKERKT